MGWVKISRKHPVHFIFFLISGPELQMNSFPHELPLLFTLAQDLNVYLVFTSFQGFSLPHMLSHFSYVRLCKPIDCSLPGSPVYGILQARILEWVASLFYRGSSQPRDRTPVSYISCLYWQAGSLPLVPPGRPLSLPYFDLKT